MEVVITPGRLCQECVITHTNTSHQGCIFCQDAAFEEGTLCDLNRRAQRPDKLSCSAFRPALKSSVKLARISPRNQKPDVVPRDVKILLSSDRFKYRQTLAVQRIRSNPDMVFMDIQYHIAWNVRRRRPMFSQPAEVSPIISSAFSACNDRIGGLATLLWLASDHIHVYVESDGERSIEMIVKELKRSSAAALCEEFSLEAPVSGAKRRVWDRAYFAETIG
jgi:REP element-mobilizing transposase RayT